MDTINRKDLINKIMKHEKLLPGDKITYDRLLEISQKYGITPRTLAVNIFGVTQAAYNGLKSKASNAKNIIILKKDVPQTIEKALALRNRILSQENLNAGNKINYERLQQIATKYNIREKILAIYVFEIPEYSFRKMKYDENTNAIILNKKNNSTNKNDEKSENIRKIREEILLSSQLKAGDKISYNILLELSKKYNIPEKKLAIEIFDMSTNSYNHIKYDSKRNARILPNYFLQENLSEIKSKIVEKERLYPYDEINYDMLQQIAKRYNINERVLALNILELTQNQYYNMKYNSKMMVRILKSDYTPKTLYELKKSKNEIFEQEHLTEGYRISFFEIEMLQSKYNLSLKETLYIIGVTQYSYNFIKANPYYKAIVKDTEVLLISQILNETMEKDRYYSKEEIEQICQDNDISIQNFLDYILGRAIYFGYEQYRELLDKKCRIWIGDRHELSKDFTRHQIGKIQHIADTVSKYIYNHYNSKDRKLEQEDLSQDALLYILTQCGDLEKNFDGDDLSRMIYLRTRMNMLKQISMNSKIKVVSTTKFYQQYKDRNLKGDTKNVDLDLADLRYDTQSQAIENIDNSGAEDFSNITIIEYLSKLLEQGYDRDTALNKTAITLGVDKVTMLEAMKQELLKRGKVKETEKGEFVLGDE